MYNYVPELTHRSVRWPALESIFTFRYVISKDQTQITRLTTSTLTYWSIFQDY